MTVYFVTVLLMLNVLPPLGWIQHTFAYTDKKLCEQYINCLLYTSDAADE